jgi:tetratricopeptide (TPR) repeat protein
VNVTVLVSVFILVIMVGLNLLDRIQEGEKAPSPLAGPSRQSGGGSEVAPRPSGEPSAVPSRPPGFQGRSTQDSNARGNSPDQPAPVKLDLSPETITPELVARAIELARQHPDDELLRGVPGQAYLMLAERRFTEGRYQAALGAAVEAEKWDAPPADVAWWSARACLELQDLEGALDWAQAALAFGPDPDMYYVIGQVHYLREDMDRAVEVWKHALSLREDDRTRAALEKALREKELADGFERQRLSHFVVRYEGQSMEDTGRMVLGSLERSYAYLKSTMGFEPAEPLVVILYSRRDYAELGGPDWSVGFFDGKVRVPVRGLARLDQHIESTLRHELTHAFVFARTGTNCPRWLHEGLAEYCEGRRSSEIGEMLAERIGEETDFSHCLIRQRCDVYLFYPAALSLVEYMLQSRSMGGMRDLLARLGEGQNINEALQEVYGKNEVRLMGEWLHFVKRRF